MVELGYPVRSILERADVEYLTALVPDGTLALVQEYTGKGLSQTELADLVTKTTPVRKLSAEAHFRQLVLEGLPEIKILQLADRLGVAWPAEGASVAARSALSELSWNAKRIDILAGFLGAELVHEGSIQAVPSVTILSPERPLFEHQLRAAYEVEAKLSEEPHKCVLHLPTGVGKTRTAMFLVAKHLINNPDDVVIWLAHGLELLNQAADEFEATWKVCGNRPLPLHRFWGGQSVQLRDISSGLVVMSLDRAASVYRGDAAALDALSLRAGLVVFDEAHQCVAPTYSDVTGTLTTSGRTRLLGLTATPGRTWGNISDDAELSNAFARQKVMLTLPGFSNPIEGLIEQGYLAKATFRVLEIAGNQLPLVTGSTRFGGLEDYPADFLELVSRSSAYNSAVLEETTKLAARHERIMLFASTVAQARLLNAVLVAEGYQSDVVAADTPPRERAAVIRSFKSRRPGVRLLINYGVLTTGFDAPMASAAVIARPTQSLVLYSQMVGRVLRGPRAGGTDCCEIVTVVDPQLPGFGDVAEAFTNWEDVWTP